MRKSSLFKQTVALVLAGVLAFGNLSTVEAADPESGQEATEEVSPGSGTTGQYKEYIFKEDEKVFDASGGINTKGGGEISIYDGYYTNLYFENEPFIGATNNWDNFIIETNAPAGTKGWTLRADAYGWMYGDGVESTMDVETSWGADWDKFKQVSPGAVIISAYKYDANNMKFYIQFSSGDTEIYTLTYPNGIPSDLLFYVGGEHTKLTREKITYTEVMLNSIGTITLDKQTAEVENEYMYASAQDKEQGKIAMSTRGSVDISAQLSPVEGEQLYFKNVKWQVSDESKATIEENTDGTVTVSLTDKVIDNDKITVTASAADGSKAQAQCEITAKVTEKIEAKKVDAISVPDQTLSVKYSDTGAPVWDSVTIKPVITPDDADVKEVTLTTDSDVVTINGSTITAVKEGEATVTATSNSSSQVSCNFKVTVKEPQMGELTSDFIAEGFRTAGSGFEKLTGDFCIVYHFTNKTKGTKNYDNFIFELTDGHGKYTTLRADTYGWGLLHDGDNALTWSGAPSDWDSFKEAMKDAEVMIVASRNGNAIEVKYHIVANEDPETVYDFAVTCSCAAGFPETLFARITGEKVEVSNISLVNGNEKVNVPVTKDAAYTYKSEDVFKNVKIGSSVTFGVTPIAGYAIKKVSYGETTLTADTEGNYKIPFVTDKDTQLTIETEVIKYPITYIVDGVAQAEKGEFTISNVVDGKVALKEAGEINGWYASANDKTTKITAFTAAEHMTNDGITVYGYNPYKVTLTSSTLTNGTIETFDTTKSYYMGDEVSIVTVPKQGYTANISVSYKDANEQDKKVETTKASKDGKEVVSFTMPAANVTVTCAEFTGIDKSALEAAITAATAIYNANNADGKYTEASYNAFKEAYDKAVQAKNATTQSDIDTAKNNLLQAQKDLKTVGKVTLDNQTITIKVGETSTLKATVTTDEEDKSVTWSSSKEAVATVKDGVVTAVAEGETTITATAKDGAKAECKVTVTKADEKPGEKPGNDPTLTLNKSSVTLYTGKASKTVTIGANVTGASKTVTWSTSNKKVATVSKTGKITAVSKGKATITAKANGITKTVKVTVKNPTITAKNGKKKISSVKVKKGKKVTLTVSVSPKNSGSALTKLKSKDKKIATVTYKKGKLTIKGKKKGKITLKITSGKATKQIKVTVK